MTDQSKPDQMSDARALIPWLEPKNLKIDGIWFNIEETLTAALDEIATLRTENERLRSALRECVEAIDLHGKMYPAMVKGYTLDALNKAREALKGNDQ